MEAPSYAPYGMQVIDVLLLLLLLLLLLHGDATNSGVAVAQRLLPTTAGTLMWMMRVGVGGVGGQGFRICWRMTLGSGVFKSRVPVGMKRRVPMCKEWCWVSCRGYGAR